MLTAYIVNTVDDVVAADGFISLREALQAANTNAPAGDATAGQATAQAVDTISFAASLGNAVITLSGTQFEISDSVRISLGDALSVALDADGLSRVVEISGSETEVNLTGLTFSGGRAAGDGGAIALRQGALVLTDVTIENNEAAGDGASIPGSGGGIFAGPDTVLTVSDSFINNNSAIRAGGGIEATAGSTSTLTNITLDGNTTGPTPGNGGGLHITGTGTVTITGSTITNNTASAEGGGLWNSATGTLNVIDNTITDNTASGALADQGGGGVFNDGGTLNISGSTITSNIADGALGSGGGLLTVGGAVTVTDTKLDLNTSNRAGGGIEIINGNLKLTDVELLGNITGPTGTAAPGNGGALHVSGNEAMVTIDGGRVAENIAALEGGGLWNQSSSTMTVKNGAVIEGNIAKGAAADDGGGGIFNNGGIVIVDGSVAEVLIKDNVANGTMGSGGGILTLAGTLKVTKANIEGNSAVRAGGGIEATAGSTSTLTNITLDGNSTGPMPGNGGGLHLTGTGTVTITGSTVTNNTASAEGGGLWNSSTGTFKVIDTTITDNTARGALADQGGGGVFNDGGTLTITGSTITSNIADGALGSGGGLLTVGGAVTVTDTKLDLNTSNRAGGGIEIINGNLKLTDTELLGNVTGPAGTAAPGNGGALHVSGNEAMVTIDGGRVAENIAALEGGGLWNQSGSTMMVKNGTVIEGNIAKGAAADDGGGGIFNNGGIVIIDGSVAEVLIKDNLANGAAGSGGGILTLAGTLTVTKTRLEGNSAVRAGGGIEATAGSTSTLTNIILDGNSTGPTPGNGGGLHITGAGTVTITDSTVTNNTATNEGGGLWNSDTGVLNVIASTIATNTSGDGGGIFGDGAGGKITVTRSTVSGNSASRTGGGISIEGGTLTVNSATIANNDAVTGGGLRVAENGTATLINTIVGANSATPSPDISGTVDSNGFNLIQNLAGATVRGLKTNDKTGVDPRLAPLADNGGPTQTHELLNLSPAINAGTLAGQPKDQRGFARPQGFTFDIGAFESDRIAVGDGVEIVISANDAAPGSSGDGIADTFVLSFDGALNKFQVNVNGNLVRTFAPGELARFTIQGSSDVDTITIADMSVVGQKLIVNGMGGNDSISVTHLARASSLQIDAGAGKDIIHLGSATVSTDTLLGSITVNGGTQPVANRSLRGINGSVSPSGPFTDDSDFVEGLPASVPDGDILNIIDTSATTATQYIVDHEQQSILRQFKSLSQFSGIETINVTSGAGDDFLEVRLSSSLNIVTTFSGNQGDDTLVVTGTEGKDAVVVQELATGTAARSLIEVDDVEFLVMDLRAGNDIALNDTLSAAALLMGGRGDDILVGGNALDVLFGGAGVDALLGHGGNDFLFADLDVNGDLFRAGGELLNGGDGMDKGSGVPNAMNGGLDRAVDLETALLGSIDPNNSATLRDPDRDDVEALRNEALQALATAGLLYPFVSDIATELGTVDFRLLEGLTLIGRDSLSFSFMANLSGTLTIEASPKASATGAIRFVLLDDEMNFIAVGTPSSLGERLDVPATAGDTLRLAVFGDSSEFDVRINNMVSHNSPLTVNGTPGNDQFELQTSATGLSFVVNGTSYDFGFDQANEINFVGGGGDDEIKLLPASAADRLIQGTTVTTLFGANYQANLDSIDQVRVLNGNLSPLLQRAGANNDVNGDGYITPLDALLVINFISRNRQVNVGDIIASLDIPAAQFLSMQQRVDVTGDNQVTALDALRVINALSRQQRVDSGQTESERADAIDQAMAAEFGMPAPTSNGLNGLNVTDIADDVVTQLF